MPSEHNRTLRYLLLLYRTVSRTCQADTVMNEILAKYEPKTEKENREWTSQEN